MRRQSSKNYKYDMTALPMGNKRGQLAVFIIIAVIIVAIILVIVFYPKIPLINSGGELSPTAYLKSCVQQDLKKDVDLLSSNGGYSNPDGTLQYKGDKIKYLCYTSEYFKTCIIQQPLVKEHFENELNSLMQAKTQACVQSLEQEFQKRGYEVSAANPSSRVEINPGEIVIAITTPMTVTKNGASKTYNGFNVEISSQMYDLLMLGVSIIDYESTFGDSETTLYLQYYPDLSIEKTRLGDGSKVYRLTNVITNESFRFATRSLVWPPG